MEQTKKGCTIRGRLINKEPNPIDVHVGCRLRLRRTVLGYSQQQLAKLLGLTFQQIQKYEKGLNRIGASRLYDISCILRVSMDFFFEDMSDETKQNSPMMISQKSGIHHLHKEEAFENTFDPMKKRETLELVSAYYKIHNRHIAKQMFDLMVSLSKSNSNFCDD